MRIGFDAKRAIQNFTGLGNYSRYLIEALCRYYPGNEYLLFAPAYRASRQLDTMLSRCPSLEFRYPEGMWKHVRPLWRTFGITHRLTDEQIDIYHGLSNELPLNIRKQKRAKSVITVHDLIFIRYPHYYQPADRRLYTYKYGASCRNADAIVAISECTKRDSFALPASEAAKQEVKERYQLPERYVLNVGSIEERKNALLAVEAMLRVPESVHLVIVGKRTPYTEKVEHFIEENRLQGRVHLLHNVAFRHLPALYQQAEVFVYPSRFEGFGIPVLEALHSQVPVIAATGSCLEEAGGPDSVYIHPDDVSGMASVLNRLLDNPDERHYRAEQGKRFAARFSEKQQAEQLINLYQSLLAAQP